MAVTAQTPASVSPSGQLWPVLTSATCCYADTSNAAGPGVDTAGAEKGWMQEKRRQMGVL